MFWIFHIFEKNRINNHLQIQVNNSFSFKLSLKIPLVSGNRSLTWTRYLNIEVPRWALLDPVNESLWSRHDIQKPVGVKMFSWCCLQQKVEVEKNWEYCYRTVNGRNLDLVDMEHIPYFYRVFIHPNGDWEWDFLNHQNIQSFLWVELVTISVWILPKPQVK